MGLITRKYTTAAQIAEIYKKINQAKTVKPKSKPKVKGVVNQIDNICALVQHRLGKYKDANGQELEDYNKNIGIGFIIFAAVVSFIFSHSRSNNTVINNYLPKSSEKVEKTVVFGDITCKVDANGYFCNGKISEEDKAKLEQIKAELK